MSKARKALDPEPRRAAIQIIGAHVNTGAFPDRMIEGLPGRRGATMEIAYGAIRQQRALRWILTRLADRPPRGLLKPILLAGLYELLFMTDTEPYAAVNECVQIAKDMLDAPRAGFANAVLRRAATEKERLLQELGNQPLGVRSSHPDELIERWTARFGQAATETLCKWNNSQPKTTIRISCARTTRTDYLDALRKAGIEAESHPFLPELFLVLPHGVAIQDLPGYEEGLLVAQDPSTSIAVELLDPQPGERVLDACAAPGGKTSIIAERMQGEGELVAMDLHEDRLARLRENLQRLRHHVVRVVAGDMTSLSNETTQALGGAFDRILLDVPCTNTGVLRRRPDARWRFSIERLHALASTQRAMLDAAAGLLKPGGRLVYSTCSLEPEENEDLIAEWLSRNPAVQRVEAKQFLPPASGTDGAYAAALHKR